MKLMPSAGSDRAWVWTVQADFADEEAKVEQLAIRFKNSESKKLFFVTFCILSALGVVPPDRDKNPATCIYY